VIWGGGGEGCEGGKMKRGGDYKKLDGTGEQYSPKVILAPTNTIKYGAGRDICGAALVLRRAHRT
jgi:hypothetical protein